MIENVRLWPSGSAAEGRKEYACPTVTAPAGVPEIVGALLPAPGAVPPVTVMLKAGSAAWAVPSETVIAMPENAPTSLAEGVPESRPVSVSNCAHEGLFAMLKARTWPSGSAAAGTNEYALPATIVVKGVPLMVGGVFCGAGGDSTVSLNGGSAATCLPSLTLIWTFGYSGLAPVVGVPLSLPEIGLNVAHSGRLLMLNVSVSPSGSLALGSKRYCSATLATVGGVPVIVGAEFAAGPMPGRFRLP